MANGPNGPMTPEEKQAQEDRLLLLKRQNEAAQKLGVTLQAVAEAMGDEVQFTKELNEQNKRRIDLLEKQVKLQALGKKLEEEEALELKELTENTKEFAKALKIAAAEGKFPLVEQGWDEKKKQIPNTHLTTKP